MAPGTSASAQAIGKPGKPPPDPKSTHTSACGASATSCSESATCRVQTCAIVDGAIRLIRRCQLSSSSTKASSRFCVSRETGVSVSARFLSAAEIALPAACSRRLRGKFFAALDMRDQQRQRRRRHAIDAARMSDGARPMRLQFLFRFVRQSRQRSVIEIVRQREAFVAPIGGNVRRLARKIDIVLGVDLDLLGDLASSSPKRGQTRARSAIAMFG